MANDALYRSFLELTELNTCSGTSSGNSSGGSIDLASPGPIGDTLPSTAIFSNLSSTNLTVSGNVNTSGVSVGEFRGIGVEETSAIIVGPTNTSSVDPGEPFRYGFDVFGTSSRGLSLFVLREDQPSTREEVASVSGNTVSFVGSHHSYGGIYIEEGNSAQTGIGATPVQLLNWNGANPSSPDVVVSGNQITVNRTGTYHVVFHASFIGTNNSLFKFTLNVNGIDANNGLSARHKLSAGGDESSMGFNGFTNLTAGDVVTVYVSADSSGSQLTVDFAALSVISV